MKSLQEDQSFTMNNNSAFDLLDPHIQPPPLRHIIIQYFLPPSISSYGMSFKKRMPGRISIRSYYEISAKDQHTGEGIHVTLDILQNVYAAVAKIGSVKYDAMETSYVIYGNVFSIDFILDDPSYDIIRKSLPYKPYECPTCYGFSIDRSDKCEDCFGMGVEVGLRGDDKKELRDRCESARRKKEGEVPDEEIRGVILILGPHIPIEFSLKSLFCAIHRGTPGGRIKDYNKWESDIRSLPMLRM